MKRARSPSPAAKNLKSSQKMSKDKTGSEPTILKAVNSIKKNVKRARSPSPAPKSDTSKKFGSITKDSKLTQKKPEKFAVEHILEPIKPKKPRSSFIYFSKSRYEKV